MRWPYRFALGIMPRAGGVPKSTSDRWSELHQDVAKMRRCLRCQCGAFGLRLDGMCAPATAILEHGLLEAARIQLPGHPR